MITKRQRWGALLGTLALTLLAVRWVDSGEAPPAATAAESAQTDAPAANNARGAAAETVAELRLERLKREPYPALKNDLFRGDTMRAQSDDVENLAEGGKPRRPTGPPPPPPLPFAYMGKMLDDGEIVVFLTRGDRNYVVRKGATIDGQYRVDAIHDRTMVLTYLPAKAKQSLTIGSAP